MLSNRYTMGCPPVRGDNPRALASGLSYEQVDKHSITILCHPHQCRPCTSRDISCLSWYNATVDVTLFDCIFLIFCFSSKVLDIFLENIQLDRKNVALSL